MPRDLDAALARIRHRRAVVFGMWLAYLPLFVSVDWIAKQVGLNFEAVMPYAFFLYAGTWIISGLLFSFSRCPHCSELFFYRFPVGNSFGSRCRHCGLSLRQPPLPLGRIGRFLIVAVLASVTLGLIAGAVLLTCVAFSSSDGVGLGFSATVLLGLAIYSARLAAREFSLRRAQEPK